ncbi:unnamed protein product [Lymnaea stagnalis]|uniref:Uncharacterized protein n=1 Tax=Lymnaea stagnalis TaxID=6523 RepID=A0AAV2HCS3_LYMST
MNDPHRRVSAGLYRICFTSKCVSYNYQGGAISTSRAFIMIAFFCAVAGLVGGVVYYRKYFFNSIENRKLVLASAVLYFVSAGVGFLGAIIVSTAGIREVELFVFYAFQRDLSFSVSFSLGLGMVGVLSSAGAGILTVVHMKKERVAQGTTPYPVVVSSAGEGVLMVIHTEKELVAQSTTPEPC